MADGSSATAGQVYALRFPPMPGRFRSLVAALSSRYGLEYASFEQANPTPSPGPDPDPNPDPKPSPHQERRALPELRVGCLQALPALARAAEGLWQADMVAQRTRTRTRTPDPEP